MEVNKLARPVVGQFFKLTHYLVDVWIDSEEMRAYHVAPLGVGYHSAGPFH